MIDIGNWSQTAPAMSSLAFGYLCGSIPFGVVLTRLAGKGDIRAIGSGNIGATNVLRTGSKFLAAATLIGDMFKGAAAVLAASSFGGRDLAMLAGLAAFLGHLFPIWLGFRGGKGVATYIGVLVGLVWPAALAFCLIWIAVAAATRYSSASALVASAMTPGLLLAMTSGLEPALFGLMTVVLWLKHCDNISRLLAGTESKIGRRTGS